MGNFTISHEKVANPRITVVKPTGYFDQKGGESFAAYVMQLVEGGDREFVFCFGAIPVINSTGISNLLTLIEDISLERQCKVHFCCLSKMVADVFRLIGLAGSYNVYESHEKALAELAKAGK